MSGNTETTSNSVKFAPMPMSALLANLVACQNQSDSPECSYSSADESNNSFDPNVNTLASSPPVKEIKKEVQVPLTEDARPVTLENNSVHIDHDKENKNEKSKSTWTYSDNENNYCRSTVKKSEIKKRNILMPIRSQDAHGGSAVKRTPNIVTVSAQQAKVSTPVIKSGIRKFTPSSKPSLRKTPKNCVTLTNRDSVRCLFPEKKETEDRMKCPPPAQPTPVPETPSIGKSTAHAVAATPSHPQGVVGKHGKVHLSTISIRGKDYMYIKKLGTGGSSIVYKMLEMNTSKECALKRVDLSKDADLAQGYFNEVRLLRVLQKSDRVIKLYDYEYDRANLRLNVVLEAGETDLSSFLRARAGGLPPALVLHYWEEMLQAVHYIHENGVIHADLKPANFLLVSGRLKLIDFGIASAIGSDATSVLRSQATGTYSYISPEALGGPSGDSGPAIKISFKSDVWSLGCILYSMVYRQTPFQHIPNLAKLAAICNPNHRIDYPPADSVPQSLIAAMKWCLTYKIRGRPSVAQLLAIDYLHMRRAPLPAALLTKLRAAALQPQELALLQRAYVDGARDRRTPPPTDTVRRGSSPQTLWSRTSENRPNAS